MGAELKPEGRKGDQVAFIAAMSATTLTTAVSWFAIWSQDSDKYNWFTWHPILQPLAMLLFTYAILTLQPTNQPQTKAEGLDRHALASYSAFPLAFGGVSAAYYNKELLGKLHTQTWHANIGMLAIFWVMVQVLFGAATVWENGKLFGGSIQAKKLWKYHRASGYTLYIIFMLTVHLGGSWSCWGSTYVEDVARLLAYDVSPAVSVIAVCSRIRLFKMKLL